MQIEDNEIKEKILSILQNDKFISIPEVAKIFLIKEEKKELGSQNKIKIDGLKSIMEGHDSYDSRLYTLIENLVQKLNNPPKTKIIDNPTIEETALQIFDLAGDTNIEIAEIERIKNLFNKKELSLQVAAKELYKLALELELEIEGKISRFFKRVSNSDEMELEGEQVLIFNNEDFEEVEEIPHPRDKDYKFDSSEIIIKGKKYVNLLELLKRKYDDLINSKLIAVNLVKQFGDIFLEVVKIDESQIDYDTPEEFQKSGIAVDVENLDWWIEFHEEDIPIEKYAREFLERDIMSIGIANSDIFNEKGNNEISKWESDYNKRNNEINF